MKTRSRMTGVALVLALSMGSTLAACGGGSDDADTDAAQTTSTPSADAEPTPDAAPTTAAEPEGDANDGDKPSKDDVVAGYTKIVTEGGGGQLPEDIVKQVVTCFVDELYDSASAKTLQGIADAQPTAIDPADAQLFADASSTCTSKITG